MIKSQKPPKFEGRVVVKVELDEHRQGDADGRLKPTLDILKESGVIVDDRKKYVKGSYIGWAPVNECVVTIEECDPWQPLGKVVANVANSLGTARERDNDD